MGVLARLEALYAELPEVACQGKCQTCCGPIEMSPAEQMRIRSVGIEIQPMTEARTRAWEQNRKFDDDGQPLWCNALNLDTGRCDAYEVRPMICRLWGVGTGPMACPFGCVPTKRLSDQETMEFLIRSMHAGGGLSEAEYERAKAVFGDPEMVKRTAEYMNADPDTRARMRAEMEGRVR
jgi:hypothetical protein